MGLSSVLLIIGCFAASVQGHGYLMEPPGRASAWRFGFDTPVDYNDNECFCGGFSYQYQANEGKCGICGDAWDADPREHEVGGLYATGTLVRNYVKGQIIPVTANVTANHLGHFEYKICANNNVSVEATQECLDLTPLYGVGHEEWFLYIGNTMGVINHELQLPADLECSQCVLQWRYVASNTWGICKNGTEGTGCGPQEEFRGCADVSILAPQRERERSVELLAEPTEEIINTASKEEDHKTENVNTVNEEATKGANGYPASEEEKTNEQNVNTTGEEATTGANGYPANEEEKTNEQNVNTTGEEATTGANGYPASEEAKTNEQNINTTGEEEEETTGDNVHTASEEEVMKEENVNTIGEDEEPIKEETAQRYQEATSKLKEMPSSVEVKNDEQEEVSTDKKKSKRDEKSEEESDDDESDEDEATVEIEE